jgi:hypothetical protein
MYDKAKMFFHDFRVIPRTVIMSYLYILWDVVQWYEMLANPSTQQTVLLTTIVGFAAPIFAFYTSSISGVTK